MNSENAPEQTKETLRKFRASIASNPAFSGAIKDVETRGDIQEIAPQFNGSMKGWKGYFNRLAGYARAADAMEALYNHCVGLGVHFALGDAVSELLYQDTNCTGARTASSKVYNADLTILALGAYAASVLPSVGVYQEAIGIPVLHLKVTDEEAFQLRGIPVTFCRDLGFFFEPDPKTNLIKFCPATAGYTYMTKGISLPPEIPDNYRFTPAEEERKLRQLVQQTLPALADRPFVEKSFCWFMETTDHDYVIDFVPNVRGLLVVSGDSGHGFKMLPIIGAWILKTIEDGEQRIDRWKWKGPGKEVVDLHGFARKELRDVEVEEAAVRAKL